MTKNNNNIREIEDAASRQSVEPEAETPEMAPVPQNRSGEAEGEAARKERVVAALIRHEARPVRERRWGRR